MVVLKKVRAATLMETLVATVLIIVVFMIASMILNNLFLYQVENNTQNINTHMQELEYFQTHNKLELPFYESYGNWEISIGRYVVGEYNMIDFEANNKHTEKTISKQKIE